MRPMKMGQQMRVLSFVSLAALCALPCTSSGGGVAEQNLQYSMNAALDAHTEHDCRNWTAEAVEWRKEGISIDAARLALTLAVNAAASRSRAYSTPYPGTPATRNDKTSCDSSHNFE